MRSIGARGLVRKVRLNNDADSPIITYRLDEKRMDEYVAAISKYQDIALDLDAADPSSDDYPRIVGMTAKLMIAMLKEFLGFEQYEEITSYLYEDLDLTETDTVMALLPVFTFLMEEITTFIDPEENETLRKYMKPKSKRSRQTHADTH